MRFNGATALRPWTADTRRCAVSRAAGFNGATALRPWTAALGRIRTLRASALQWGHGLAAVDGARLRRLEEPLHGFNGATALRPWTGGNLRDVA